MSTFTRRQFNRTLMASVGSVWARDVAGNGASQANQQQTWAGSITDVRASKPVTTPIHAGPQVAPCCFSRATPPQAWTTTARRLDRI